MPRKKTHEEYEQKLQSKDIKIVPLEKYQGNKIKIKHQCDCGNEWLVAPNDVLGGYKCGCGKVGMNSKTHEEYLKSLKDKGIKIKPLEEYKGTKKKILHKCYCGNEWHVLPASVLAGQRCMLHVGESNKKFRLTHIQYLTQLKEANIQVIPLEPYVNTRTRILHKCVCGNEWLSTPDNVFKGAKCGCISSKGELIIKEYLAKNNISFKRQKFFKDLKDKHYLRYDFAIYQNYKLLCLIEYHGQQHFQFTKLFHTSKKDLIEQQKRDQIKKDYAAKKDIPLIEILYNDTDPIRTLEKELKALGIGATKERKYEQISLF